MPALGGRSLASADYGPVPVGVAVHCPGSSPSRPVGRRARLGSDLSGRPTTSIEPATGPGSPCSQEQSSRHTGGSFPRTHETRVHDRRLPEDHIALFEVPLPRVASSTRYTIDSYSCPERWLSPISQVRATE